MARTIKIILAIVFVWAAAAKVVRTPGGPTLYDGFVTTHPFFRFAIPSFEVLLGLWLLVGASPIASSGLTIAFLAATPGLLAAELFKSHPLPCGCMGAAASLYSPEIIKRDLAISLGRNALMIIGCAYLIRESVKVAARSRSASAVV